MTANVETKGSAGEPIILLLANLAIQAGLAPLADHFPNGCWERAIGDKWWIAFNGHMTAQKNSKGQSVPPCSVYVEWLDWPAGIIDPTGGLIAAGAHANEETFAAAIEAAIKAEAPTLTEDKGSGT